MTDIATRASGYYERTKRPVFDRLGGGQQYVRNQVCKYWLAGKCNRSPCRFLHPDSPKSQPQPKQSYDHNSNNKFKSTWRNPNQSICKNAMSSSAGVGVVDSDVKNCCVNQNVSTTQGPALAGNCSKDQQKLSGFCLLTKLEKHNKAVTGITLPSGSDKLFSGSKDECVCVWDCNTGQCITAVNPGGEVGCLISEGPWVFVGLQNAVKAWNIQTETELLLTGPVGLVKALVTGDDILFGGVQDGSILAWKSNAESNSPELVATLKGHKLAVLSLVVGAKRLYSGSKDDTIRVWDIKTFECLQILNGHTNFVTSLICWDSYLLSGSLDKTLKVWAATESGCLQVIYEVKEESGILALSGIEDAETKPILLCSCKDNSVHLYDLPSFAERGRISAKSEVEAFGIGCGGLFFTGDATGQLSVWKLVGEPTEEAMSS
ncbi:hypothetical protein ACH5RR_000255 [Cinchona calisaya]|uniref:C3H1-type domain-containing protein n=1 Tax=Cinchona calisaya TaxID=153742 RepID=A0ABD3B0A3_9GENT